MTRGSASRKRITEAIWLATKIRLPILLENTIAVNELKINTNKNVVISYVKVSSWVENIFEMFMLRPSDELTW
jgi:hypothetical protein